MPIPISLLASWRCCVAAVELLLALKTALGLADAFWAQKWALESRPLPSALFLSLTRARVGRSHVPHTPGLG